MHTNQFKNISTTSIAFNKINTNAEPPKSKLQQKLEVLKKQMIEMKAENTTTFEADLKQIIEQAKTEEDMLTYIEGKQAKFHDFIFFRKISIFLFSKKKHFGLWLPSNHYFKRILLLHKRPSKQL